MQRIPLNILCITFVIPLFWSVGCGPENQASKGVYSGPRNTCDKDADCRDGTSCAEELKRCVLTGVSENAEYYVIVYPKVLDSTSASSSQPSVIPHQGFQVTLDAEGFVSEPLDVYIPISVPFEVQYYENGLPRGVDFVTRVIMAETGSMPDFSRRIYDFRIPAESRDNFRIKILPRSGSYQLKVIPDDTAGRYRVAYFKGISVSPSGRLTIGQIPDQKDFKIKLYKEENRVTGRVFMEGVPVNGLTVQALYPESGLTASTSSVTRCATGASDVEQCGKFTFTLDSELDIFTMSITRPKVPGYPKVIKHGISAAEPIIELQNPGPPVRFRARIERPAFSPDASVNYFDGMPGCFVYFESVNLKDGTASQHATTNEKGEIVDENNLPGVDLYRGEYRMTVVPPGRVGTIRYDFDALEPVPIDISGTGEMSVHAYTLERRPVLSGRLYRKGKVIPEGRIFAEPLPENNPLLRRSSGKVLSDGSYSLWIDTGLFRLTAEAPPESGFAWKITSTSIAQNEEVDLELPIPFVATAELRSANKSWEETLVLEDALVEWYQMIDNTHVLVGRSYADANGKAVALLPPPASLTSR